MNNPFPDPVVDEYNDDSPDKTRERYRHQQKLCQCGFTMTLETKVVGFAMQYRCLCSTRLTKEPTHPLQQHDTPTAWADSPDAAWLAWQAVYILTH